MATLKATKLREALQKAKNVGVVEELVTIAGCEMVFQNLPSEAYETIMADCAELEDVEYYNAYQIGHISRAIVEIDGTDLRDVVYVEDEVPDPKDPDKLITRKFERHEWLRENVLTTWGREAIAVAWRKFAETLLKADELAKKGVEFIIPDETAETRYRRLLSELQEAEQTIPSELATKVLDDAGYLKRVNLTGLDKLEDRAEQLKRLDDLENGLGATETAPEAPQPIPAPPDVQPPDPTPASPQPAPAPSPVAAGDKIARPSPTGDPREMMRSRTPLNRRGDATPTPAAATPVSAQRRVKVPDQIRQAAMQNTESVKGQAGVLSAPVVQPETVPQGGRASHIAALEGQVEGMVTGPQAPLPERSVQPVAEIRPSGINPREVVMATDPKPPAGVNKKYNPPPRQP